MLLFYLLLTLGTIGSSLVLSEDLCYGSKYRLPGHFTPPLYNQTITYTPKVGEPKIVVNNGQSLDPRYKVSRSRIEMADLTEQDNGAYLSIKGIFFNSVILRVKNCGSPERRFYGSFVYWIIPDGAEYLEFSKYTASDVPVQSIVLWNRTDPSYSRGKVSSNDYEIKDLTQQDSGYYKFRGSKNQLLKWKQIRVEEHIRSYVYDEGNYVNMEFPVIFTPYQVRFTPVGTDNTRTVSESDGRVEITDRYLAIEDVTLKDAGIYDFVDREGNLILHADLEIKEVETPAWVNFVILAAIAFGVLLCCCCVKKCCCKKSSNKRDSPASEAETEAAAPNVYYHGSTQPTQPVIPLLSGEPRVISPDPPTYTAGDHMGLPPPYTEYETQPSDPPIPTYSYQLENPPLPAEPTVSSPDPPTNDLVMADVSPPPPPSQVSATGASGPTYFTSTNYDLTTSDCEPRFDLKGLTLPSAPPLSSDGSTSAEYTSDKLNFM